MEIGRRSEVGGQKSEIRGQRSDIRGQKSDIRGQRSEIRRMILKSAKDLKVYQRAYALAMEMFSA